MSPHLSGGPDLGVEDVVEKAVGETVVVKDALGEEVVVKDDGLNMHAGKPDVQQLLGLRPGLTSLLR